MAEIIRGTFSDFDDLTATARGWDLELSKLDCGPFVGEIFQWITDGFILSRGRFCSHMRQEGTPPPGLRTMTLHIPPDMSQYWRGRQVTGNDLLVFPGGSEVDTVSDPRFDIFTLSFDEEALMAQADRMECRAAQIALKKEEVFQGDPNGMERLRKFVFNAARSIETAAFDPEDLVLSIQNEVIRLLEGAAGSSTVRSRAIKRLATVQSAQAYLRKHSGEAVSVTDLSRAVGVSIRTLQYAFQEHIGIGPKAYINALRLNAARKNLQGKSPGAICVSDVANRQGFWHMGQFAADYRKLFGEYPSQTLTGSS